MLACLTALALSLGAVYATVSYLVGRRTSEIGVRIALGGRPRQVVVAILSQSLKRLGIGVGAGIAFTWALRTQAMTSVSWGALLIVSAATVAAGLVASLVPTLRAASVQPTVAIRSER